ncbi:11558_t:CDS:2, partial [Dentiscutata erythropus]
YESMTNRFISELEVSKRMKNLVQVEVKSLTEILKSYEEKQHRSNRQRIGRVQVIEDLLIKYKKELEQVHSNYNQKLEDQYCCSEINLHANEILYQIEKLQIIIHNLENENANLLKETISLQQNNFHGPKDVELNKSNEPLSKTIDELQDENLLLQKHESVLKDTMLAVKSENTQLLEKLKQLQKTIKDSH